MRDELFDRDYQDGREALHGGVDGLFGRIARGVAETFEAIHRVEWDAPWKRRSRRSGKDCTGLA